MPRETKSVSSWHAAADSGAAGARPRPGENAAGARETASREDSALMPAMQSPIGQAVRGEGAILVADDGRRRIDLAGGTGVHIIGHCHPEVTAAIARQAQQLVHAGPGLLHAPYQQLAARLVQLGAGDSVFLCNSGAEAVEAALKMARLFFAAAGRPRARVVACEGSFHGRTMGALAVSGQASMREGFGPPALHATFVPYGDLAALAAAVGEDVAAVVLESVLGSAGVVVPPPGFLAGARDICARHGALLVLDEVQTGIGRLGHWFAWQRDAVAPDILCLGKALGGGLPLAACAATRAVAQHVTRGRHGTTFGGNPVACAAGLATLEVIEREGLLARAERLAERVRAVAGPGTPLGERLAAPLRGAGALWGLPVGAAAPALRRALWREGVLVSLAGGGQIVRLFLPLNIELAVLDQALATLVRVALADLR